MKSKITTILATMQPLKKVMIAILYNRLPTGIQLAQTVEFRLLKTTIIPTPPLRFNKKSRKDQVKNN